MTLNKFFHLQSVSRCTRREAPMLRADISPCREKSRRLEIRGRENPAARNANPKQNGACPLPSKEFVLDAPNTSEWDARWQFFRSVRIYPNSCSGARDDSARQRFQV